MSLQELSLMTSSLLHPASTNNQVLTKEGLVSANQACSRVGDYIKKNKNKNNNKNNNNNNKKNYGEGSNEI